MMKLKVFGTAMAVFTLAFSGVSTYAADVSALTNSSNGYYESTERKVANYLQSDDVVATDEEVVVTEEAIDFETAYIASDSLFVGEEVTTQEGVKGVKKVTTTNKLVNGKIVDVSITEEVVTNPVNEIIKVGTKEKVAEPEVTGGTTASGLSYSKVLTIDATAYCPCSKCCGKWANGVTASGLKAGYGVAAVDPKVIPLGTKLYVEGYGYCIAADTGGAIKGNRIDLCYGSHSAALASGFGHKATKVYILN
ncbi:MAG: 3D domain-containing protein [Lachnospirales bacterium]